MEKRGMFRLYWQAFDPAFFSAFRTGEIRRRRLWATLFGQIRVVRTLYFPWGRRRRPSEPLFIVVKTANEPRPPWFKALKRWKAPAFRNASHMVLEDNPERFHKVARAHFLKEASVHFAGARARGRIPDGRMGRKGRRKIKRRTKP